MEPTEHNLRAFEARFAQEDEAGLPEWVRAELPDVAGRHVLVLGCGEGGVVAELVAAGALVTGVDEDEEALEVARARVSTAVFLRGDLGELPAELRRARFDLVLTPVRASVPQVVAALRPAGEAFFRDVHPVLGCLDAALRWRESYFREELVQLGEVVTAAVDAGLVVVELIEAPAEQRNRQDPRVPGEFLLRARKPAG